MARRRRGFSFAIVAVSVGLLAQWVPVAQAAAATYHVQLDAITANNEPWSFLRYFPATVSVHQGDVIDAAWGGFAPHTATVIPSDDPTAWRATNQGPGGPQDPATYPYTLMAPDTSVGGDDAGEVVINPAVLFPSSQTCGIAETTPCPFDGTSVVNSGFSFGNPASQPSFFVRMDAAPGTYAFVCLVHPGMQEIVNVTAASTTVPTPDQVASRITRQVNRATKIDGAAADAQAQSVAEKRIAGGHHRWTIYAGGFSNGVSADEYSDEGLTVSVGDQIQVLGNFEIHTATVPKASFKTIPFVTNQCEVTGADTPASSPADCTDPADFQAAFNTKALFPTKRSALARPSRFVNSGLLVPTNAHTFDAVEPGVYTLVCLVHGPSMHTTITVK
jgi:plastocyanin